MLGRGEVRGKTLLYGEVMGRKTTKFGGKHDALRAWGEWGAELKGNSIRREIHLVESPSMAGWQEGHPARVDHVLHLVDPLLLAPLVLEPHLDHPHRQARFFCQLLSHQSGRFRVLIKTGFENFELFCFYGCSWSSPFAILAFFLVVSLAFFFIVRLVLLLLIKGLVLIVNLLFDVFHRNLTFEARVHIVISLKFYPAVLGEANLSFVHVLLEEVLLAEKVSKVVEANPHAPVEWEAALRAGKAGEMELGLPDRPHTVLLREHDMTGGASRAKHPVKVSLAVELAKLGKAGGGKGVLADGAPQAILVQVRPSNLHHKGVPDREPALRALGHGLLLSSWSLGFNIHRHRGGGVFVVTLHTFCATASGLSGQ